jgi:aspartate/methionine/tyrosine aminotransferase
VPELLASATGVRGAIARRAGSNLAFVRQAVDGSPVSVLDVEGGWYVSLRVPRTRSELEWVISLLEHDGVHVQPGHFFDFEQEAYLVASLLTREEVFHDGVTRLVRRVSST